MNKIFSKVNLEILTIWLREQGRLWPSFGRRSYRPFEPFCPSSRSYIWESWAPPKLQKYNKSCFSEKITTFSTFMLKCNLLSAFLAKDR